VSVPENPFTWRREDTIRTAGLLAVIVALHLLAWGVFVLAVVPSRYQLGSQIFGFGLGVTAYTLGMRHAFDADHIAAIDNTTRKLMADASVPSRSASGSPPATPPWSWCWRCSSPQAPASPRR